MLRDSFHERGQALMETAIALSAFLIVSVGLIDGGRAFYQYNAVAQAARYGARWGSVVGGECLVAPRAAANISMSDWCNQLPTTPTTTSDFWNQSGNHPLQAAGVACPSGLDGSNSFYFANFFTGVKATTIAGAIVHRFDTTGTSSNLILGLATPGFDHSKLEICIYMSADAYDSVNNVWRPQQGSTIGVSLYYPFSPAGPLLGRQTMLLVANSQYEVE